MTDLKNRIDFVYLFDVQDGNPNGDPDAGNLPRVDAETGMGLVTDVCLKRKVRNYVQTIKNLASGFDIFIREGSILNTLINDAQKIATGKGISVKEMLCRQYYDIRTFGAVISTGDNAGKADGQVRGPIQLTFARSIDSISTSEHSITRMAVTNEKDKEKGRTMGRKSTVPYGLYRCHGFISPSLAKNTGFSEEDLNLFWEALKNMFDMDRSAARGLMSAQKLTVFTHNSEYGNAPANQLFDLVTVKKKEGVEVPRKFSDYIVTVDKKMPDGVTPKELIKGEL